MAFRSSERANGLPNATYAVQTQPACALITGNATWEDNGGNSGDMSVTGSAGLNGLVDHIQINNNYVIPSGDTFAKMVVKIKDAFGVQVEEEETLPGVPIIITDATNGIDLQSNLTIWVGIFTENCTYGHTTRFNIVLEEPTAHISGYTMPNIAEGIGTIANFVNYTLEKYNNLGVIIPSDEGIQAWTGSEVGTFTAQTFEDGDIITITVVDDALGSNILSVDSQEISIEVPATEEPFSHDFTDIVINAAVILAISPAYTNIDNLTIVPKGDGVTYTNGAASSAIEVGRSLTLGNNVNIPIAQTFTINNPSAVEINIVWDPIT